VNHLSLFTGSGIGDLAARDAGIRTVAMCENDPACCYCLERLWPDARLFRDVHDVTAESLADLGPIDIISGGFPCTDISTAGKGAGLGTEEKPTRSGLWFEFARVIQETRPRYVLVENVPALRVRGADRVLDDLDSMGYTWWAFLLGADDVGAPHRRKRVWIVGRLEYATRHGQRGQPKTERANRERTGAASDRQLDNPNETRRGTRAAIESQSGRSEAPGAVPAIRCEATQELGHPASDRQRRTGSIQGERPVKAGGPSGYGDGELADTRSERRKELGRLQGPTGTCPATSAHAVGTRWPSRPGEPQHEWEAPRLVEFGLGDATDGVSRRVRSRANKALLRMVGNAWTYQCALMLFRGIVELDRELTGGEG
jgi:DNA (cytosine-5)-methyltransferase 1